MLNFGELAGGLTGAGIIDLHAELASGRMCLKEGNLPLSERSSFFTLPKPVRSRFQIQPVEFMIECSELDKM